jgi:hypothetical protein
MGALRIKIKLTTGTLPPALNCYQDAYHTALQAVCIREGPIDPEGDCHTYTLVNNHYRLPSFVCYGVITLN